MSFKIGSLTCVKYIEKQPAQYQTFPISEQNNVQSQILKRVIRKKMSVWGNVKSSFHRHLPGGEGLTEFLVKKDCKIKYGFENPISDFDLGLSQLPNNQLVFSSLKCWNYLGL